MSDEFREITTESWFSKILGSFVNVLVGILLILISVPLLWFNEGCSVKNYKALKEGVGSVQTVSVDRVDPSHEGKLVHTTGTIHSNQIVTDSTTGIGAQALNLKRKVEVYQWVETIDTKTEKNLGGSTDKIKKYKYDKIWSDKIISSNRFKIIKGHENPNSMIFTDQSLQASQVTFGAFQLSPRQIAQISTSQPLSISSSQVFPKELGSTAKVCKNFVYIGNKCDSTKIGDIRISYLYTPNDQKISILGKQVGSGFGSYQSSDGKDLFVIRTGTLSAKEIFAQEQSANNTTTWILRVLGFMLMCAGFAALFSPIAALADVIPLFGGMVEFGAMLVGLLLGATLSSLTIGLAWLFYRPLLGITLIIIAIGLIVLVVIRKKKS